MVHDRLKDRPPGKNHSKEEDGLQNEPEILHGLIRELELEVRDLCYRLGRSEACLELAKRMKRAPSEQNATGS